MEKSKRKRNFLPQSRDIPKNEAGKAGEQKRVVLIFFLFLPFLFLSIILHEVAHGVVSYLLGDPTPRRAGRLTANPLAHLDPLGTLLPILLYFLNSRVILGWAKPVPIRPSYYKNWRVGVLLVGAAGPFVNLMLAFFVVYFFKLLGVSSNDFLFSMKDGGNLWMILLGMVFFLNIVLAVFNLLPIPPLDGSRILQAFLPHRWVYPYLSFERYGITLIVLILLLFRQSLNWLGLLTEWVARLYLSFL